MKTSIAAVTLGLAAISLGACTKHEATDTVTTNSEISADKNVNFDDNATDALSIGNEPLPTSANAE